MQHQLLLVQFFLFMGLSASDCCPPYSLDYSNGGATLHLCLNGKQPDSWYCGVGSCNPWACKCEGGCLHKDPFVCLDSCLMEVQNWSREAQLACGRLCAGNLIPLREQYKKYEYQIA